VERFSQSVLWLQRLILKYPELKDTEFHLNEWGMSSNYYRTVMDYPDLKYRNNEESALFLVKLVNLLYQVEDNYNFPTSILLYWGFCGEAAVGKYFTGQRDLTTGNNIPKPIQTGFEMLAKLKEQRVEVVRYKKDNQFGILATRAKSNDITLIAYNYEEDEVDLNLEDELFITINRLQPNTTYKIAETLMDNKNNNTYAVWKNEGSPATPSNVNESLIKNAGELEQTSQSRIETNAEGVTQLKLTLKRHSMKLIEISESK
jgi:hypothetical protein